MNQQFELPTILRARETHWRDLRQGRSDGRVERVRRGFYVTVSRDRPAWEVARDRELAAIAAAAAALSCAYAFSHTTAARLLGLSTGPWDGVVHITTRRRHGSTARAGVQRHFSADPPTEFGAVGGLTTTIVERTIIDCARTLHPREALIVADSGLRRLAQMNRFERIESEQRQHSVRSALLALVEHGVGRPGFVRAGIVLGNADGFRESPGESGLRWTDLAHGLPTPTVSWRCPRTPGCSIPTSPGDCPTSPVIKAKPAFSRRSMTVSPSTRRATTP